MFLEKRRKRGSVEHQKGRKHEAIQSAGHRRKATMRASRRKSNRLDSRTQTIHARLTRRARHYAQVVGGIRMRFARSSRSRHRAFGTGSCG